MQAKLDLNHGFSRRSRFLCESIFCKGIWMVEIYGFESGFFIYKNFLIKYIIN